MESGTILIELVAPDTIPLSMSLEQHFLNTFGLFCVELKELRRDRTAVLQLPANSTSIDFLNRANGSVLLQGKVAIVRRYRSEDAPLSLGSPPSAGKALERIVIFHDAENCYIPNDTNIDGARVYNDTVDKVIELAQSGFPGGVVPRHSLLVTWKFVLNRIKGNRFQPSEPTFKDLKVQGLEHLTALEKKDGVDNEIKSLIQSAVKSVKAEGTVIALLSGDIDYATEIRALKRAGFRVVLLHRGNCNRGIVSLVNSCWEQGEHTSDQWDSIIAGARGSRVSGATPGMEEEKKGGNDGESMSPLPRPGFKTLAAFRVFLPVYVHFRDTKRTQLENELNTLFSSEAAENSLLVDFPKTNSGRSTTYFVRLNAAVSPDGSSSLISDEEAKGLSEILKSALDHVSLEPGMVVEGFSRGELLDRVASNPDLDKSETTCFIPQGQRTPGGGGGGGGGDIQSATTKEIVIRVPSSWKQQKIINYCRDKYELNVVFTELLSTTTVAAGTFSDHALCLHHSHCVDEPGFARRYIRTDKEVVVSGVKIGLWANNVPKLVFWMPKEWRLHDLLSCLRSKCNVDVPSKYMRVLSFNRDTKQVQVFLNRGRVGPPRNSEDVVRTIVSAQQSLPVGVNLDRATVQGAERAQTTLTVVLVHDKFSTAWMKTKQFLEGLSVVEAEIPCNEQEERLLLLVNGKSPTRWLKRLCRKNGLTLTCPLGGPNSGPLMVKGTAEGIEKTKAEISRSTKALKFQRFSLPKDALALQALHPQFKDLRKQLVSGVDDDAVGLEVGEAAVTLYTSGPEALLTETAENVKNMLDSFSVERVPLSTLSPHKMQLWKTRFQLYLIEHSAEAKILTIAGSADDVQACKKQAEGHKLDTRQVKVKEPHLRVLLSSGTERGDIIKKAQDQMGGSGRISANPLQLRKHGVFCVLNGAKGVLNNAQSQIQNLIGKFAATLARRDLSVTPMQAKFLKNSSSGLSWTAAKNSVHAQVMTSDSMKAKDEAGPTNGGAADVMYEVGPVNVSIRESSWSNITVDCMVNPSNVHLSHFGGLAKILSAAAGPGLQQECDSVQGMTVGGVYVSKGYNLKNVKYLAHTVVPRYANSGGVDAALFRSAIAKALKQADSKGCRSVAIPGIGCGVFQWPPAKAAELVLQGIALEAHNLKHVKFITLFDINSAVVEAFHDCLSNSAKNNGIAPLGAAPAGEDPRVLRQWYWQADDGSFKRYDAHQNTDVDLAYQRWVKDPTPANERVRLAGDYNGVHSDSKNIATGYAYPVYDVSFSDMRQYNAKSGFARNIKREVLPAPQPPAAASQHNPTRVRVAAVGVGAVGGGGGGGGGGASGPSGSPLPTAPSGGSESKGEESKEAPPAALKWYVRMYGAPENLAKMQEAVTQLLDNKKRVETVEIPEIYHISFKDIIARVVDLVQENNVVVEGEDAAAKKFCLVGYSTEDVLIACNEVKSKMIEWQKPVFPPCWEEGDDQYYEVPRGTEEFNQVAARFTRGFSCTITQIQRVQNTPLYKNFWRQKNRVMEHTGGIANEELMLHGTSSTRPDIVCLGVHGLDPRYSSEGRYGRGTYFAEDTSYSHNYFKHRADDGSLQIIVALVVKGNVETKTTLDKTIVHPSIGYHSIRGLLATGQYCIITYEQYQAYPLYLVTYKA